MRKIFIATISVIVGVTPASAQNRWPVFFETSWGRGGGTTEGEYRNNSSGITADALVGFRPQPNRESGIVLATAISMQGAGAVTTICIMSSTGGCIPSFPEFLTIAGLIGYEKGVNSTIRISVGPGFVHANDHSTLGLEGRLDAALPVVWRLSALGSFRVVHIPDHRGDQFTLRTFGLGIRIR